MTLRIYWGSGSPVSWRVLLALAIKGIEYESVRLNLSAKEFKSESYLALNPRGSFPLLVSGEFRVRGSLAILNYLEKRYPKPALFGTTTESSAMIWQCIGDHEDFLGPATETITRAYFRKKGDHSAEALDPSLAVVAKELAMLEEGMSCDWLIEASVSAADIVLYPTVQRLLRAAGKESAELLGQVMDARLSQFPKLQSWLERMNELPGVEETYPPHWRDS